MFCQMFKRVTWHGTRINRVYQNVLYTIIQCQNCRFLSLLKVATRVDMVGTNHDKVLTLWRHMPMGQFRANIFLIRLTSTYFWASEVFKNQSFKSQLFSSPLKKNASNWNHGLILMLLLFFIYKIQKLYQFSKKKSQKIDFWKLLRPRSKWK